MYVAHWNIFMVNKRDFEKTTQKQAFNTPVCIYVYH